MAFAHDVTDELIQAAWDEVLASWDDPDAHDRFIKLCALGNQLAEAGKRYRDVRENDPSRAAEAARRIDQLLALAMRDLAALKTVPDPQRRKTAIFFIALGVSGALVLSALWAMLHAAN